VRIKPFGKIGDITILEPGAAHHILNACSGKITVRTAVGFAVLAPVNAHNSVLLMISFSACAKQFMLYQFGPLPVRGPNGSN